MQRLTSKFLPLLGLSLAFACGGDDGSSAPDAGDAIDAGQADAAPLRNISGTVMDSYLLADNSVVMAPQDLSALTIAAHVPDGSGGYTVVAGSGMADGTFSIQGVAAGKYLLQLGALYRQTDSSTYDFGRNLLGRPDVVDAAAATTLTFDVDGLNDFAGESLNFHAPNGRSTAVGFAGDLDPALLAGATSITGTVDWTADASESGLVDSTKSDIVYLFTRADVAAGAGTASVISQFVEVADFNMTDAAESTFTATLADVAADQTVAVSIDPAPWAAEFAKFGPTAALPPSLGFTAFINSSDQFGDLSFIELMTITPPDAVLTETVSYANPFPGAWVTAGSAFAVGAGFLDAPANTVAGISSISAAGNFDAYAANVVPVIGAIEAPMVDGMDLSVDQTGGATPTISWSAPTTGTAKFYFVTIRQVGGGTFGTPIAQIGTADTSLVIPPNLLTSGQRYYFSISATDGSADYNTAPNRFNSFVSGSCTRPTALLTVE